MARWNGGQGAGYNSGSGGGPSSGVPRPHRPSSSGIPPGSPAAAPAADANKKTIVQKAIGLIDYAMLLGKAAPFLLIAASIPYSFSVIGRAHNNIEQDPSLQNSGGAIVESAKIVARDIGTVADFTGSKSAQGYRWVSSTPTPDAARKFMPVCVADSLQGSGWNDPSTIADPEASAKMEAFKNAALGEVRNSAVETFRPNGRYNSPAYAGPLKVLVPNNLTAFDAAAAGHVPLARVESRAPTDTGCPVGFSPDGTNNFVSRDNNAQFSVKPPGP